LESNEADRGTDRNFVTSLARGLAVIQAFGPERPRMTLAQVAQVTDLPRAAARRSLLTLAELGYVAIDGKMFQLTPATLRLGFSYLASQPLSQITQPYINNLRERFRESSSVSLLDGHEIIYIARASAPWLLSSSLNLGSRLPAYCTSMGRVLLAALSPDRLDTYFKAVDLVRYTDRTVTHEQELREILVKVRTDGFCIVDQEREIGLRSIAVPIANRRGVVMAALNVSGQAGRLEFSQMRNEFLPVLQETSRSISAIMPE
jgi:IclR family transcriptional regulator, pca regulon regulatory protein